MIVFNTNYGSFTVELDLKKAPKTTANFIKYVEAGFYDGTIFHRVIDNFMIQGGGFEAGMMEKPNEESIENEANNGLSNVLGTLAMARTSEPHSATSQFFINVSDNLFLDHKNNSNQGWGYAVFGRIIDGMGTINRIKACETRSSAGHQDVPVEDIVIESVSLDDKDT
jgi:peptidyl-prolyl cis-trans isomerase B (cyclophilin B)